MRLILFIFFIIYPFILSSQDVIDSLIVKYEQVIYFDSNKYDLDSDGEEVIKNLIIESSGSESYKYLIDAHTDDLGSFEFNLRLSENRKQSVLNILKENGIPDSLIISNYHGEIKPITSNKDDVSRQQNRRVVIQLLATLPLIKVSGIIHDESTNIGLSTEVTFSAKDFSTKVKTNQDGQFSAFVPLDQNVLIEATAKDYYITSKVIKTSRALLDKIIKLPLPQATIGKTFELNEVLFVGNSPQLLSKSKSALRQLKRFMFINTEICIEIAGHVNTPFSPPVKKGSFDMNLSIARANTIQDSLVSIGIGRDRILSRGYGNWHMVYPEAKSETQMEKNRRVEVIISSCDSTAILPDHEMFGALIKNSDNLDKLYNPLTIENDLRQVGTQVKRDIFLQLKRMVDAGRDPERYSYKELLKALPDLPEIKN